MEKSISTKPLQVTFANLTKKLRANKRLFFTRFGDGDFFILNNQGYKNHKFSEALRVEMEEAFLIDHPEYMRSTFLNYKDTNKDVQRFFFNYPENKELNDLLNTKYNKVDKWEFENCNSLPYYALYHSKEFVDFLNEFVRPKKKLLIGGVSPETAKKLYGNIDEYVQTPMKSAYNNIDEWWQELEEKSKKVDLILPACGAASKVINKRLWNLGYDKHVLDIGSIIDAIDHLNTRKWIRLKGHKVNSLLLEEYQDKSFSFKIAYFKKELFYNLRRIWKNLLN